MDCSPPGSSVHGILQARTLEWVAMPSSRGSSQPRNQTEVSRIAGRFFTVWATREALLEHNWSQDFMMKECGPEKIYIYLDCIMYCSRFWEHCFAWSNHFELETQAVSVCASAVSSTGFPRSPCTVGSTKLGRASIRGWHVEAFHRPAWKGWLSFCSVSISDCPVIWPPTQLGKLGNVVQLCAQDEEECFSNQLAVSAAVHPPGVLGATSISPFFPHGEYTSLLPERVPSSISGRSIYSLLHMTLHCLVTYELKTQVIWTLSPPHNLCYDCIGVQFIYFFPIGNITAFPGGANGKESTCQGRRCKRLRYDPWVRKIPWRRKWQPTPVFLPGKFYGQRSLAGYSLWDHKKPDTTEGLSATWEYYRQCCCVHFCTCAPPDIYV